MAYSPNNIGWNQVNKKVTKATRSVIKTADEWFIPKTPADVASFVLGGKVLQIGGKLAAKGTKKVIKAATKTKKVIAPTKKIKKVANAAKDEIIMARAGWNDAAKKSYRIDVKRGTYNKPKKVTKVTKKK